MQRVNEPGGYWHDLSLSGRRENIKVLGQGGSLSMVSFALLFLALKLSELFFFLL